MSARRCLSVASIAEDPVPILGTGYNLAESDSRGLATAFPGLLVLALALASSWLAAGSFAVVQESAKVEMGLSDFQLSLVQGFAVALPVALLSVPLGAIVDRGNRMRMLTVLAVLSTAGTIATAFVFNIATLFAARMLTQLGAIVGVIATMSVASDLTTSEHRGLAMMILTLGKWLGTACAFLCAGLLLGHYQATAGWIAHMSAWRSTHLVLGVLSALTIPLLLFMREPARQETAAGPNASFGVVFGEIWSRRGLLLPLFAGQVGVIMADVAASIWAAPILSRSYGLTPDRFAGWMSLVIFAAGILGSIFGGVAADLGQKTTRWGGILIGAIIVAALSIPTSLFSVAPSVPLFGIGLTVFLLCGTAAGLIAATALTVALPNEVRGLCIGLYVAISSVIGFGIAPALVTLVSRWLGGESHLGLALAITGVVISVLSLFAFVRGVPYLSKHQSARSA